MTPLRLFALLPLLTLVSAVKAPAAPNTLAAAQQIDSILQADWAKHKVKGNPQVDEATFVRRIYLDIIGRIPTTREAETFLSSKDTNKRAKLIDKLLASEGYVQHAFNYWADVLRAQSSGNQAGQITGAAYVSFLKDGLRANKPYDKLVRDLISAQGDAWDNGAIGYYMRDRGMPLDNMANTARVFLGTRVECAQCHNHPFDKWTQMQFYQMAAFTYPVQTNDYYGDAVLGAQNILRKREQDARDKFKMPPQPKGKITDAEKKAYRDKQEQMGKEARLAGEAVRKETRFVNEAFNDVRNSLRYTSASFSEGRKVTLPHDYKYDDAKPKSAVAAKTMFGHEANVKPGETQLQAYARWMASPENERFNKVVANRLWKRVFGLALIEPLDELMDTSVPMNPELQAQLEKLIVDLKYDMKAYLRILYTTSAYQRQVTREEVAPGVVYHFTGPLLRRMTAEQLWDSFVTLINPNPDMPNEAFREQLTKRVLSAKKVSDSLDSLTPEEVLAGAEVSGRKYKAQADRVRELQTQISEARAKEDKVTVTKLRDELNKLQRETRYSVNKNIILPGMQKLAASAGVVPTVLTKGKGENKVVAATGMDMMMAALGDGGDVKDKIFIPGYDKPEKSKEEELAAQKTREEVWKDEAEFFGIPEKSQRDYFRARSSQIRNWVRSAEIDSPAPRGHYLREFGQSDREIIENANNEASVPQALAMMNGQLLPQILDRFSQLMLTVNKAQYPDDKVEAVYKTILGRKATAREKEVWLKAQDQGLTGTEDLIYALLNTQQFIFVQ
ncbi:MAG: DUF1549 domain-containing protein [Prosthecobacter sp.]|nr:DUF1549 domain-containing protein [Prosthecobacter sp.]